MLTVCKDSKLHSLGPEGMGWSLANEDEAASITGLRLLFLLEEKESHDHDLAHDVPQPSNLSVCVCACVFFFWLFLAFFSFVPKLRKYIILCSFVFFKPAKIICWKMLLL